MKQLKRKMPRKEKPKKKVKAGLTQKERFIEYARDRDADESGETFEKSLKKILPKKSSN